MTHLILAENATAMTHISLWRLALSLVPVVVVGLISWKWTRGTSDLVVATLRMLAQLLVVGYVLVFLFKWENPWIGVGVVSFMVLVSSWIAIRTVRAQRLGAYWDAVLAVGVGGGLIFALVVVVVLDLHPWYQPRYVIPIAGMIFSNAMTAVTLSAERFTAERVVGRNPIEARNAAWSTALIPQVNSFLAVGLVSLPGMMTGQILAGASPLDAVRYQIMVMTMILGSAGFAVAIYLLRTVRRSEEGETETAS